MKSIFIYKNLKILIFVFILVVSFWRSPYIFLNGRFIGEEANLHLIYALENTFFKNLLYYDPFAGYYNITPNLMLWLATKVPLELAPLITVYGSFIFIILLPYLCLFRESKFFDKENKKIIGSLILFLSPPLVPELWLNSLNTQIYLCFISIVILFMINLSRNEKIFNHSLILISGLSAVYSCALLPLYAIKFFFNRGRYNLINFVILFITTSIQLSLIIKSKLENALHSSVLSNDFSFDLLINFFYNVVAKPFFGRDLTHLIWNKLFFFINYNFLTFFYLLSFFLSILIVFKFKSLFFFTKKNNILLSLIIIFFTISFIVIIGSLENHLAGRYAAIPGIILILCVLEILYKSKNLYLRYLLSVIILLSLMTGFNEFRPEQKNKDLPQYIKFLDCINCPDWKTEVKIWRNNNSHIIGIWPYPFKNLDLSKVKIN